MLIKLQATAFLTYLLLLTLRKAFEDAGGTWLGDVLNTLGVIFFVIGVGLVYANILQAIWN